MKQFGKNRFVVNNFFKIRRCIKPCFLLTLFSCLLLSLNAHAEQSFGTKNKGSKSSLKKDRLIATEKKKSTDKQTTIVNVFMGNQDSNPEKVYKPAVRLIKKNRNMTSNNKQSHKTMIRKKKINRKPTRSMKLENSLAQPEHSYSNVTSSYHSRVDFNLKGGNKRNIGQIGLLMPLLQNRDNLLFATIIGMRDSRSNTEGNFGLGFRKKFITYIFGGYGFYDFRKTQLNSKVHQLTLGVEYLSPKLDARFNVYIPDASEYCVKRLPNKTKESITTTHVIYETTAHKLMEVSRRGFDVEVGVPIPQLMNSQCFLSYYFFNATKIQKSQAMHGVRSRVKYQLHNILSLEGEIAYDNVRKFQGYVGFSLNFKLGRKQDKKVDIHFLDYKMTQSIIRDIDVVASQEVTGDVIGRVEITHKERDDFRLYYAKHAENVAGDGECPCKEYVEKQANNGVSFSDISSNIVQQGKNLRKEEQLESERIQLNLIQEELQRERVGRLQVEQKLDELARKEAGRMEVESQKNAKLKREEMERKEEEDRLQRQEAKEARKYILVGNH